MNHRPECWAVVYEYEDGKGDHMAGALLRFAEALGKTARIVDVPSYPQVRKRFEILTCGHP